MLLPTLLTLLASLCIAERYSPHGFTLAPRVLNTSVPTITLSPMTSQSLFSVSIKLLHELMTEGT